MTTANLNRTRRCNKVQTRRVRYSMQTYIKELDYSAQNKSIFSPRNYKSETLDDENRIASSAQQ